MKNFILNVFRVGLRDALFWASATPGGPITRDRIDAHCRALGRAMGRCMMIQQVSRYNTLRRQQARLIQMMDKLP